MWKIEKKTTLERNLSYLQHNSKLLMKPQALKCSISGVSRATSPNEADGDIRMRKTYVRVDIVDQP